MSDPASPKRKAVDWTAVERDYRAGVKGLREMGREYGVSAPAIMKRAKRDGWTRDLSAKIKAKADALVNSAAVNTEVNAITEAGEREVVEANAAAIMHVRLEHRKDIKRARTLAMNLLAELEQTAEATGLIERLWALIDHDRADVEDEKERAKRWDAMRKVLELPTRTQTMKALAETMTKLIALEREAYSLATDPEKDKGDAAEQIVDLLRQIDGAGTGLPSHATAEA